MTQKKPTKAPTASRRRPEGDGEECTERVPLMACRTWASAGRIARQALAFIMTDPHESAGNRIKAAELVLDRAYGRPVVGEASGRPDESFEDWLAKQDRESRL